MPFSFAAINKYLPLIKTGLGIAGNVIGSRQQTGAINQAGQINQQATNDAMAAILGLYDEGQRSLSPYQNVGPGALANLQRMAGIPAQAPSAMPSYTGNAMARFGAPNPANPLTAGGGSITNAMGRPQPSGKGGLIGGAIGTAAPLGLGLASGALLGAGPGFGLGLGLSALGGPIGLGLGLAGSLIGSQFGKNNPFKEAASKGIDQVSRNIWGSNTPGIPVEQLTSGYVADAVRGRIPVAQARTLIKRDLDEWVAGMRANGTPDSVIQSSIATQRQHLAPLKTVFDRLEMQGQPQQGFGGQPNANF